MKKIYKNWFVHNVFGHGFNEIFYWIFKLLLGKEPARFVFGLIHDATLPEK